MKDLRGYERVLPVQGTEVQRAWGAAHATGDKAIKVGELHSTDQDRLWLHNVLVSGGKPLGVVANEAARLALNTTQAKGCHPGDFCYQTSPAGVYFCISNNGGASGDWWLAGGGGGGGTAAEISFDPATAGLVASNVQAAVEEVMIQVRQGRMRADAALAQCSALAWFLATATAGAISYDHTASGMAATNVQDAIDELKTGLGAVVGFDFLTAQVFS